MLISEQEMMRADNAKLLAAVKAMLLRVDACEEDCGRHGLVGDSVAEQSDAYDSMRETLEPLRAMVEGEGA